MNPIELRSDNCAGVAPEILAAIEAANTGTALAYGADAVTAQLTEVVRDVFQQGEAKVFPVLSGTAANSLALSRGPVARCVARAFVGSCFRTIVF